MRLILLFLVANLFAAPPRTPPPVAIEVKTIKANVIAEVQTYLGSIESVNSATLALERAGVVSHVFAKDNSYIAVGAPILQINSKLIAADLESAAAKLKLAKTEQARLQKKHEAAGSLIFPAR